MPSTAVKWISLRNHRNKKVVQGKHNVLIHYVDVFAPNPSVVVHCNSFIWDILWFISDRKSCCHNSKMNIIPQPQEQKVVGGKNNVLIHYVDVFAPDPSSDLLCHPFIWDILQFISIEYLAVCVPSTTTAEWISFLKHMNRNL